MKEEFINPLIEASKSVLESTVNPNTFVGEPYENKPSSTDGTVGVCVGITGNIRGQVVFSMERKIAYDIASKLTMRPVTELNEITRSAVSELCNMIMGNTASILFNKGIEIDITPPAFLLGENLCYLGTDRVKTMCIPFDIDDKSKINVEVFVSKND